MPRKQISALDAWRILHPDAIKFTVSKDGKTVNVGGNTYSVDAFEKRFKDITFGKTSVGPLKPGETGSAETKGKKAPMKIEDKGEDLRRTIRTSGGIGGPNARNINKTYRMMGPAAGGVGFGQGLEQPK